MTPIAIGPAWHHAAATYDGTTWNLYLDGNLEATLVVGKPPQHLSIQHAGLATALNSTGAAAGFFHGVLDEARIWDAARTQTQIQTTINTQITSAQPGLVARWGLDEGAGTTVFGSAGTTTNGAITGPTTAWAWANAAPFNLVFGPPNAPSGLSALATSHASIHLAWIDNSTNETSFELERSTTGIGGTYAPLATLPAGTTGYDDAGLDALTEYCYRIRAVSSGGQSAYDGPQCATTPAETNNALDLGGTNAYVTFGRAPGLGAAAFTLECWFRRDGAGVGTSTGAGGIPDAVPLVTKGRAQADGGIVDMNYFLGIRASDSVLVADFEEGAAGDSVGLNHPVAGTTPIAIGPAWHHAAATYDGSTWRLYLDGCLEAELAVGQPPQSQSIQHAALGSALDTSGVAAGFFDGALDEVRIWNVARTQAEIQGSLNSAITTTQPGLIGRWSLNETGGTAVFASAGTSANGAIAGSNWTRDTGTPFALDFMHAIAASAGDHGTIAPNGAVAVACNGDQAFTITPDQGYSIASLTVDGGAVPISGSYAFTNVTADHTIAAAFADLTAPTATVLAPNGGETLFIGTDASLEWDADDTAGIAGVDLLLSRSGTAGPYETIATGIANTGSYLWNVTGPAVTDDAFLRVVAHDVGANTATDESDFPFTIADPPTGTLLALFNAETWLDGIRVRWELGDALRGALVVLERAHAIDGPWAGVEAKPQSQDALFEVIDQAVVVGETYHYRLRVTTASGATLSFGPLSATAGVPITEFEFAPVAPNPAREVARFEFALPSESQVRLVVLDVQGREVAVVAAGAYPPGRYQVTWSGATDIGRASAGVYFARCRMGARTLMRRLVLVN
ncbi:MAG TPA: LamG-like jellyroll fold domain-containing protein, partial [Candidatus Limnocylindria bacterium]|nr:LamG-like jellyroll fold domain-containing protein [Candidatus Limnocylindria bacterium]